MKQFFPFLNWLPGYSKNQFKGDLSAGLTVGIMLIPQGMAYAMIAGLPPVYGLYASLVPQLIYAFTGTSRQLAVGPVAMDSLLVASGLSLIATAGSENYILMAIALAFLMGSLQFMFGVFKLGFLVNFLSKPVISGFTSAAALIIGLNQLKHLTGTNIDRSNRIHELLIDAVKKMDETNWYTLLLGLLGIAIIIGIKKFKKGIPAALVVVVIGIILVWGFGLNELGVSIVGTIPTGFPSFDVPNIQQDQLGDLLPIAITLSLIAFMEAISVAKAIEEKHDDYTVDPNQELRALGLSNMIGAFFQSYPTTGGFSRTAVSDQAGAKTGMYAIISAAVVAAVLLFLTPLFHDLPKAVLASIIMVAVFGLIDIQYPKKLWKTNRDEFFLLLLTFSITAFIGITEGIAVGVIASLLLMVYRVSKPHIAELGKIGSVYKNVERFKEAEVQLGVVAVRFDGQIFYANKNYFKSEVHKRIARREEDIKLLVINAEAINYVDASGINALEQLKKELDEKHISLRITGVIGPVRDVLKKSGMVDLIGEEAFFLKTSDAIESYRLNIPNVSSNLALQTNELE